MARLRINWRAATDVAPTAATTGESSSTHASTARVADRPMLIFVTHSDPTDKMMNRLEGVVFPNEQFSVGTKMFDTIRISEADAARDRVVAAAIKRKGNAPHLIFLTREYKVAKVLSGKRISAGRAVKAMKAVTRKAYVNSFDKMVKGYIKLLNKLDQLEGTKARIADARARLNAKPNASKAKKIARDEKAYEKELDAWSKQEQKLLEFRVKGEKALKA